MTEQEKIEGKKLRPIKKLLNELRAVEADFPASYTAVLLAVAELQHRDGVGPSLSEVGDVVGLSRPTVGRIVQALSNRRLGRSKPGEEKPAGGRQALGLLERRPDDIDLRMIRAELTPRGSALLHRMIDHITP